MFPTSDKFRSVLFVNTVQSAFCVLSASVYLVLTKRRPGVSWREVFGLPQPVGRRDKLGLNSTKAANGNGTANGVHSMNGVDKARTGQSASRLLRLYAFIAFVASSAAPFGFLALSHISFPTLLLGKSCKLVPVMLMNILLYRRQFPLHKYVLVALVTAGIYAFMAFKPVKVGKSGGGGPESSSLLGLVLLAVNLLLDGVTNATQDHVFSTYTLDGPQMMFFMNLFATLFTFAALVTPYSLLPSFLLPVSAATGAHSNELSSSLAFIASHPSVRLDILLFGLTGAVGQIFIFVTLSLYGSLTLVTITVTRKMVTMLLSVFVFDHKLTKGQWSGVGLVFGAVAMEAVVARQEKKTKKVKAKET
ncbi:UAA transporter family-domain-containing protein [Rhodotorula diobovata]|uniref:UDP-galactose transporter homolog 1 n=1 Tax=Rhodotorula diobovata TaxID=5288 RepID=A0A5C5G4N1_9BASI|nr:UAA transporter family-domain-containing protein [Rhodotorula diobovata]